MTNLPDTAETPAARPSTARTMADLRHLVSILVALASLSGTIGGWYVIRDHVQTLDATMAKHLDDDQRRRAEVDERVQALTLQQAQAAGDARAITQRLDRIERSLDRIETTLSSPSRRRQDP